MPRGGARPGAGRPVQSEEVKKMRSLRATDKEWQIILDFAKIVKHGDRQAATNFVQNNKPQ